MIPLTEEASQRVWGCSLEQYLELRAMCKPMRVFQAQRKNARHRGVGWKLNFWQWWTIWQKSGHWEHRGRGQGYVMCRHGDEGPYAVGNVFIAPSIVNVSDANNISGLPIGVSDRGRRYRAMRMLGGKMHRLSLHETPESAHAEYLSLGPIGVSA
jgi:hypothetical protein